MTEQQSDNAGGWGCARCGMAVDASAATFHETHAGCGAALEWRDSDWGEHVAAIVLETYQSGFRVGALWALRHPRTPAVEVVYMADEIPHDDVIDESTAAIIAIDRRGSDD